MRPKGFNRQRLRLVDDRDPRAKKQCARPLGPAGHPTRLEWLLACAVAAIILGAYLWWTAEFEVAWAWLAGELARRN